MKARNLVTRRVVRVLDDNARMRVKGEWMACVVYRDASSRSMLCVSADSFNRDHQILRPWWRRIRFD